ncbi:hypothetical protein COCSUDRAFT_56481 [Coccomyxa subellipsoidea C-169]|uniref:Uncharacterized protein n=1 Tax=Coccomyxa subellipsoidea (strain C-169) TaxID=574566 RepID=I0YUI0_COCSC|nr:hypothetical protein COCSUDRAFT_56481 [Coccomyxa subellipsoidea C-169]EIE22049.1 hypothetical protein COCSUDRAFT_56481 [Coccomyxa subellipsoidea C-169]|eukprot:XP_005646593.1 hypothetical protein COCSUDRAFT_56481 [Coccomyxa subellipsoidea C-169]
MNHPAAPAPVVSRKPADRAPLAATSSQPLAPNCDSHRKIAMQDLPPTRTTRGQRVHDARIALVGKEHSGGAAAGGTNRGVEREAVALASGLWRGGQHSSHVYRDTLAKRSTYAIDVGRDSHVEKDVNKAIGVIEEVETEIVRKKEVSRRVKGLQEAISATKHDDGQLTAE